MAVHEYPQSHGSLIGLSDTDHHKQYGLVQSGPAADRPSGPWREGRVYRATDTGSLFYDTGAGWDEYAMKDYVDAVDATKSASDHLHVPHDRLGRHAAAGDWSWSPTADSVGMAGWTRAEGPGTQTLQLNASSIGSHAIDLVNYQWWEWDENIPYDAAMLYEGRVRVQQIVAGGTFYAGFSGIAADGVTRINEQDGGNTYGSQHYKLARGLTLGTGESDFYGAWAGVGSYFTRPDLPSAYAGVRYIRPVIIANYGGTGTLRVHGFSIKKRRWGQLPNESGTLRSNGADGGWQNLAYLNGWVDYGAPYYSGQYRKDASGFVHFRGLIKGGTVSDIATLPVGYRLAPNGGTTHAMMHFPIRTSAGTDYAYYRANGSLVSNAVSPNIAWVDLSSCPPYLAEA